ncbi:MAG: ABC transporter ATP-binding protein [Alphaproteobacteria bacterium]|nr:ABC transporter ATP-binding protein [Alphaproteobacteria bacterium]
MLQLERLSHWFEREDEEPLLALSDVSIDIDDREFVAIVGASGCGKSTLLRLIAGLIAPTVGRVVLNGRAVREPGPDVGLVFQHPTLLPWASAIDNVLFPLDMLGEIRSDSRARAAHLLSLVGLSGFETRRPAELSGGMQQRVAICRGLIRNPDVLLMDEPFGALDALTREEVGLQLLDLWTTQPKTIVFVTHSVSEAVMLADRVVVMSPRPGRIADIVPIPLPRPRSFDMEGDDVFKSCARRIRDRIFGHAPRPARRASEALS